MTLTWVDPKDPSDTAWYAVRCAAFLDGDVLATAVFSVPSPLVKATESFTADEARVKLSGGTADNTYAVVLDMTTTGGQTFQRTVMLKVAQQ
jgi:hypothetical protein